MTEERWILTMIDDCRGGGENVRGWMGYDDNMMEKILPKAMDMMLYDSVCKEGYMVPPESIMFKMRMMMMMLVMMMMSSMLRRQNALTLAISPPSLPPTTTTMLRV